MKKRNLVYKTQPEDGSTFGPFSGGNEDAGDQDIIIMHPSGTIGFTPLGGLAIKMTNRTNVASVKGLLVSPSTSSAGGFQVITSDLDAVGFVYDAGVASGADCWVVVGGVAQALADGSSTTGDWVGSLGAGRVSASVGPTGLGALADATHFKEVGHCIETTASGSAKLIKIITHFN